MNLNPRAAPNRFAAEGAGLQHAYQRIPASFTLTAFDSNGGRVRTGGEALRAKMRGPAPGMAAVEDGSDGTYTVGFTAPVSGQYTLLVSVGHVPVAGSPFQIKVRPAGRPARPEPVRLELAAGDDDLVRAPYGMLWRCELCQADVARADGELPSKWPLLAAAGSARRGDICAEAIENALGTVFSVFVFISS
ncbi:immunoglobulin E-set [Pavlovales sp. CCMP2436]|nr:immunoglobulin E-set [Pavlovales sp. CCMP2436]